MVYHFGPYAFDAQARELLCGGTKMRLQPKTLDLLEVLLERPGAVVTREEIAAALWPREPVHVNNLTQHVFLLRQAFIAHTPDFTVIVTLSGRGYRLAVPVEARSPVRLSHDPAWRWYARGRLLMDADSESALLEALACFERAVAEDPSLADAHACIADVRIALAAVSGSAPRSQYARAEAAALTALRLHHEHAGAHAALGDVAFLYHYDPERALRSYEQSLCFEAQSPRAFAAKGAVYSALGHSSVARVELERALMLDPVSLELLTMYGAVEFYAGSFAQATARFDDVLRIDAGFARAASYRAMCAALESRCDETAALSAHFRDGAFAKRFIAAEGFAYGAAGRPLDALGCLRRLHAAAGDAPTLRAEIFAGMGRAEDAVRELERAVVQRDPLVVHAPVHPFFASLRARADFRRALSPLQRRADGEALRLHAGARD